MNSKSKNYSENEQLALNEYKYLKLKKIDYKFIIFIFISICKFISLFIIIIMIKTNKQELSIKNQLIEKLNLIENNLKSIKDNKINYQNNYNIYKFLCPNGVVGHNKIRFGRKADGGYILLDDINNIRIAYSFGISKEISFDKELADRNIDIYMYDHTIKRLPFENQRFHWKKIGLSGIITNNTNLKTLPELLKENGHYKEKDMILKLDIESYEWEVFQNLSNQILNQFKYIVGEFHFSRNPKFNYSNILKKIQITHNIFHLHCNNCGRIISLDGYKICNLLEISFIKKAGYKFDKNNAIFPIKELDYKNCRKKREITDILNIYI